MRWFLALVVLGCQGEAVTSPTTDSGTTADVPTQTDACGAYRAGTTRLINVGGYCIDETEVTNAQWKQYIAAPDRKGFIPAHCGWNTDDPPSTETDKDPYPRGNVNLCDAQSYCSWARKRLCGKIGAGMNAMGDFADPTKSMWYRACSGSAPFKYPYGSTYSSSKCATEKIPPATPKTGFPDCHGTAEPFSLVFDLSGNLEEWEDSCEQGGPTKTTQCRGRGGGVGDLEAASCDVAHQTAAGNRFDGLGFRCCKDL
jgi:formylglycine-generating enzyme